MSQARQAAIGAQPGTLVIDPRASKSVIRVFSYDKDTIEDHRPSRVDEVKDLRVAGRNLWVDVQGLGDEPLLRGLAEIFSIHPLALEDVVHARSRPKAEPYKHNLLFVTRMLAGGHAEGLDVEQVSLLIGPDYVLTFQERPGDHVTTIKVQLLYKSS